jgi:hypothetical protein
LAILARLNPLLAPVLRRLAPDGRPTPEVLYPQETESVRPAAMLPGMLDRVTRSDEHSVLAHHLGLVCATSVVHSPLLRRVYKNALVRHSGFATARYHERYGRSRHLGELLGPVLHLDTVRYCQNYYGDRYFGHWLSENTSAALIDPDLGHLWMPAQQNWHHVPDYLEAMNLTCVPPSMVKADRLIVYDDYGLGSHKQARFAIRRDRIRARFSTPGSACYVYLRRGASGERRVIVNEDALIDQLRHQGWEILDVTTQTVADLQTVLYRAQVVVSVEGSQINHAHVSLSPGAAMVILTPNDRFTTNHVARCRALGVSPGVLVMHGGKDQGYHVSIDEVLRTVDLTLG